MVLRLGYDGAGFSGFAAQEQQAHVRTVAGELCAALRTLLRRPVQITCAGRTDAGVHARAQHVSFPVSALEAQTLLGGRVLRSLTALLPDDVCVAQVLRAQDGFSARFDAQSRSYRYRLSLGPARPLFGAHWSWWLRGVDDLDVDAMREAATLLIGEHDFKSFCKASSAVGKPTCRFVERLEFSYVEEMGERRLVMDIEGNAFLHNMVRSIMGTLVEVGMGRRRAEWVGEVLEARDRNAAGPCAPACGLTFWDVRYASGSLAPWVGPGEGDAGDASC